jgi:hypothetical protein
VEGLHFAAGPWFTVQEVGEWRKLDRILVSDGTRSVWADAYFRMDWDD